MSPLVFTLHTTADFLIQGWHIDSYFGLSITMLVTIVVGMIFEGFQSFRYMHLRARAERYNRCCGNSTKRRALALRTHVERSLLNMLQVTIGYLLMLCAMSYNAWIMISVAVGAGLGYLFVRPVALHWLEQKKKDSEESDEKWTELKMQFMNGVNEKAESKGCHAAKNGDTCA